MGIVFITLLLLMLSVVGIGIKLWAKKDGEFAGTCASQSPHLNPEGAPCGMCGKTMEEYSQSCTNNSSDEIK